jgi:hypothetical protein
MSRRGGSSAYDGPLLRSNDSFTIPNVSFAAESTLAPPNASFLSRPSGSFRNNNASFTRDVEMQPVRPRRVQRDESQDYNRSQRRLLRELRQHMEDKMTTDPWALFAAVLRRRAGVIDPSKTELVAWDTLLRKKDLQIVAYSFFGLFMSILTATMFWEFGGRKHTTLPDVTPDQLTLLYCSQLGLTCSTLVCMALVVQKYQLLLRSKRMEWSNKSMYDLIQAEANERTKGAAEKKFISSYSFGRSNLRWKLGCELGVHLLHPLIWMNTNETKEMYEAFQILIFARLYLVVNIIFKFSPPYQRRREILSNNPELQRTGFQPSVGGTLKMVFYDNPGMSTLALLVASLAILGFIIFVTERSANREDNQFRSLQNALWFAFVTFSTVGYGDMAPVTAFGRLASVACGAIGITTTTVFGGVVTNLMVQSREQRAVSQYLSETDADRNVEHSAARVIQLAYLYSRAKTKDVVNPWIKGGHKSNVVYGAIKAFKSYRWLKSQTQSSTNDPVTDSKINNVSNYLNRTQQHLLASSATVKSTRNAVRSFMTEMQSVLAANSGGAGVKRTPSVASSTTTRRRDI